MDGATLWVGHGSVLQRPDLATAIFTDFCRVRGSSDPIFTEFCWVRGSSDPPPPEAARRRRPKADLVAANTQEHPT